MSDVVAVGLTTGAVGLISSILSYVGARSQSKTSFEVGIQSSQIELAKVQSENNRLLEQHREGERKERRSAYIAYLGAFKRFDSFGFIETATYEDFLASQTEYKLAHSTLMMVASAEVRSAAEALDDLLATVVKAAYQDPDSYGLDAWRGAYKARSDDLRRLAKTVTDAMHRDVIAQMLQSEAWAASGSAEIPAPAQ